jgi:transposase-like protein
VDFRLSTRRDVTAAKLFFRKTLKTQGRPPRVITLDGYASSYRAVRELPEENEVWNDTKLRSSKYLNNIVEQDHRAIKARLGPMLGFKRFRRPKVTIAGIEVSLREGPPSRILVAGSAFWECNPKVESVHDRDNGHKFACEAPAQGVA